MGILISESHSILKPDNKIHIQHFRGIKQFENQAILYNRNTNDVRLVSGVAVIIANSEEYFFDGMTYKDFFTILNATKNTKWKGKYLREALVCRHCGGSGKTDWIRNVTDTPYEYNFRDRPRYKRLIEDTYLFCKSTQYYLTRAMLKGKHEMHCKYCLGTGMHNINPDNLESRKIEGV